jgi:hypothetical protein
MYEGIIVKVLNVREHPNADRLNLGTVAGHQVVIGKDVEEGTIGVFFPCDGRLSTECLQENNLFRHKELNKDPEASPGFFDDNGRIRAQKFRKAISEGFWTNLGILEWTGVDLSSLKEGDKIHKVNGHIVCEKYYTPATMRAMKAKNGKTSKRHEAKESFPDFKEHRSTAKLRMAIDFIPKDAILYFSEKVHGTCMSAETKVRMADGTNKKIKQIKAGDSVLGFNFETNKVTDTEVIKTFVHEPKQNWFEVIGERRGCGLGNSTFKVLCTETHEFFTNRSYQPINKCSTKDIVYLVRKDFSVTENQVQMLLGKFLGDGSLIVRNKVAKLEFSHKEEHYEYLKYCEDILGRLIMPSNQKIYVSGYGTRMQRSKTKECRAIYNLLKEYTNTLANIPYKINKIGLAFLYMDDGSLIHNRTQRDRASFALCSYSLKEAEFIKQAFYNNGYKAILFSQDGYSRIRLNTESSDRFFNDIKELVPPVMQYKLPKQYRGFFTEDNLTTQKEQTEYLLVPHTIISIKNIGERPRAKRYDISTKTENFFAHDVLVHNSGRTGYLPARKKLNRFKRLWNKTIGATGLIFKDHEYKYVTGTRRVVVDTSKPADAGFYFGKTFRIDIHNKIKALGLRKGETLYYEIVGFDDDGQAIMGAHKPEDKALKKRYGDRMYYSYGCDQSGVNSTQYKVLLYRITTTTPDGAILEMPHHQFTMRCLELGLEAVPHLEGPVIYDRDKDALMERCEVLSRGDSTLDDGHIREGVVIKVEHEEGVNSYKYKGFWFCELEGIMKNDDSYVDPEEIA